MQRNDLSEWKALKEHAKSFRDFSLREKLKDNMSGKEGMRIESQGLTLSYARNMIKDNTLSLLIELAKACELEQWRHKLFSGQKINESEGRSVLHMACRDKHDVSFTVGKENLSEFVKDSLKAMETFSTDLRSNKLRGYTGKPFTDIVNIGIGGSDLGPKMVCHALRHLKDGPNIHFVSNIDPSDLSETLKNLNPETTFFLIASKTFTTQETMANAQAAKDWLLKKARLSDIGKHFAALSTNKDATKEFGISKDFVFPFKDWVGGRFSLWSSIGLSICCAIGFDNFNLLLEGAHAMDRHFQKAPFEQNIPVLMALIGVWNRNFLSMNSLAVLPYSQNLEHLPSFLQQLDMESNGKSIDRNGNKVNYETGPIIFGQAGTNGQHAFYQHLHQGTETIPCDIIVVRKSPYTPESHHDILNANAYAQADAFSFGRNFEESDGDISKQVDGNKPVNLIEIDTLSPFIIGQLIAAYEHKIFVQGIIWNLNSFDQPGVELGKILAKEILQRGNSDMRSKV
ncbi:MAG: glucose-6-phosphate isomerase [Alphaproteobacteria bacterium]|nr:glucose-6-phosphate isomerase [Alphaproteobacteria bacterium]